MKKKRCCFFFAGMGFVLATGSPGLCQVSSALVLKAEGRRIASVQWVAGELSADGSLAGSPQEPLVRAGCNEDEKAMIETLRHFEKNLIHYDDEAQGRDYFGMIPGKIPVLISAPHGAKHYRSRGSYWKEEEAYTASLAIALGQATGAYVIYTRNKTPEDPNNDLSTRYKEAVRSTVEEHGIKFLIDLHGARKGRPFKIDLGVLNNEAGKSSCPSFMDLIEKNFAGYQKEIFNQKFTANDRCTLTYFARNDLKIEAMQVEINARLRKAAGRVESSSENDGDPDFKGQERDLLDLIARIQRLIGDVNKKISEACPAPDKL